MYEIWILITASLVAASCALVGSLLILRRMALLGDAISHSVLLGIVLVYLLFDQTSLVWMLTGATLIGLLTAWLSQFIQQKTHLAPDASLGLVFTWFFALAIVLIALYADHIHLDHEHVLFGEMAFIPFNPLIIDGENWGPKAFWLAALVLTLNLTILVIGYQRFKLTSFHPALATSLGIHTVFWHYLLMTMVSVTAVASFDLVGSILVIALMVIPAASAYLIAKSLKQMMIFALIYAQSSVLIGFGLAWWLDTSLSASMAVAAGLLFIASFLLRIKWGAQSR
ncbi:metal ABC transporter permease [Thiomicrospira microaerophila]|uniref:metal ABC transporter permease n=1 Tax=Thiomicrospira microaerophila TaxID=406020 RepID=UPI00200C9885|nr:metal ABC transporter permease [Thiomicrospira microaerophila]UQB41293.1 metal ABC transporter permease [Thiomicrospira microaerophila]